MIKCALRVGYAMVQSAFLIKRVTQGIVVHSHFLWAQAIVLRQDGMSMGTMGVVMVGIQHLIQTLLLHQQLKEIQ